MWVQSDNRLTFQCTNTFIWSNLKLQMMRIRSTIHNRRKIRLLFHHAYDLNDTRLQLVFQSPDTKIKRKDWWFEKPSKDQHCATARISKQRKIRTWSPAHWRVQQHTLSQKPKETDRNAFGILERPSAAALNYLSHVFAQMPAMTINCFDARKYGSLQWRRLFATLFTDFKFAPVSSSTEDMFVYCNSFCNFPSLTTFYTHLKA